MTHHCFRFDTVKSHHILKVPNDLLAFSVRMLRINSNPSVAISYHRSVDTFLKLLSIYILHLSFVEPRSNGEVTDEYKAFKCLLTSISRSWTMFFKTTVGPSHQSSLWVFKVFGFDNDSSSKFETNRSLQKNILNSNPFFIHCFTPRWYKPPTDTKRYTKLNRRLTGNNSFTRLLFFRTQLIISKL